MKLLKSLKRANAFSQTCVLAMALCIANVAVADLETEFLNSSQAFSQVATVTSNGVKTIYVSGQVGIQDGEVPDDFARQVDIVFSNMAMQLEAAGASMQDVIKLTGFIVDISDERVAAYSQTRSQHFSAENPPPASTLIGVSGLVFSALQVEVEAIAVIEE